MEASTLTHASRRGLLARRSPVLRLEKDERLVALIRAGHEGAFEILFNRYHARLLAFCTSMLKSRQDAEDVLQEVFTNAHKAILADDRKINVRPWLYRIARNRCLNHLRRPVPEGQDSMDIHPHMHGTTTAEQVQEREELRQVLNDVGTLPETQRTALLLREIDQLSYEEIAVAMETTIPAVKSLLVRARISLAESSESRTLSCEEVRVTLAEAAEGIGKASGPVRIHVRNCEGCSRFRDQLRADRKALASLFPIGPLAALKAGLFGKLFGGGAAGTAGGGAAGTAGGGTATAGGIGALGGSAAAGSSATAGGLGAIGGVVGTKAAAGVATAALLTAGAATVTEVTQKAPSPPPAIERTQQVAAPAHGGTPKPGTKLQHRLLEASAAASAAIGAPKQVEAATTVDTASTPPAEETDAAAGTAGSEEDAAQDPAAGGASDEQFTDQVDGEEAGPTDREVPSDGTDSTGGTGTDTTGGGEAETGTESGDSGGSSTGADGTTTGTETPGGATSSEPSSGTAPPGPSSTLPSTSPPSADASSDPATGEQRSSGSDGSDEPGSDESPTA